MEKTTIQSTSDFETLCDDNQFWAEVIAALKTAKNETQRRVPRAPGGMKAMHQRAESLETVTDALKSRKASLYEHKGQGRIKFPKPLSGGNYEMVLASGVRVNNGFKVNKKGGATLDLISLQHVLKLDFTGEGNKINDEGAFLVLCREVVEYEENEPHKFFTVLYFAYPAQLEKNGTFIRCENQREVGRYELVSESKSKAKLGVESLKPVKVTPQVGVKRKGHQESESNINAPIE